MSPMAFYRSVSVPVRVCGGGEGEVRDVHQEQGAQRETKGDDGCGDDREGEIFHLHQKAREEIQATYFVTLSKCFFTCLLIYLFNVGILILIVLHCHPAADKFATYTKKPSPKPSPKTTVTTKTTSKTPEPNARQKQQIFKTPMSTG